MTLRRSAAATFVAVIAVFAGTARAATFTVVPNSTLNTLPSAETPNIPGSFTVPAAFTTPPLQAQQVDYTRLEGIWQRAGAAYGIPWQVLGSINKIESNFGRNMGPSSAGAIGWMQFMPSTWLRWGTDANGDGVADPWNAEDAVYSAARYLAAAGGSLDISRAVYAYNHADWYVKEVLDLAQVYGQGGEITFSLDRMQVDLQLAQSKVIDSNRRLVAQLELVHRIARSARPWRAREAKASLLSDRLAAGKRAGVIAMRLALAKTEAARLHSRLAAAERSLERARTASQASAFAPGAGALLQAPSYDGGYVFPVGGGPGLVSASHTHHDYPAVDIAAPAGSPVYALASSVVVRSWHYPDSRCGIGLTLRSDDGQVWTYCHLAYEEPGIEPGVRLAAGTSVGLVGSTGHATGPHLHLQLQPANLWPQQETWFQSFAGTAFSWQDAAPPTGESPLAPQIQAERTLASGSGGAPVFQVASDPAPASEGLILFSR
jgi:murein DD-endopeptidase MepM/ murein hydrolase activator NlpD